MYTLGLVLAVLGGLITTSGVLLAVASILKNLSTGHPVIMASAFSLRPRVMQIATTVALVGMIIGGFGLLILALVIN